MALPPFGVRVNAEPGTFCVWSRFSDQVIVRVVPSAASVAELIAGAVVSTTNERVAVNEEAALELSTVRARQKYAPSVVTKPPGTCALPFDPFAAPPESNAPSDETQPESWHSSNVTWPESFASSSENVALSVGVAVLSRTPDAGETSAGVFGAAFAVLFVIDPFPSVAVAAPLPVGDAISRTFGFAPGAV